MPLLYTQLRYLTPVRVADFMDGLDGLVMDFVANQPIQREAAVG